MRGLIATLTIVTGVAGTAPPADGGDRAQIRRVFELALDQSRPIDDRVAMIEDGRRLRRTLASLQRVHIGVDISTVHARVRAVKPHGRRAELTFDLFHRSPANAQPLLQGQRGVAVRENGDWRLSRFTMCELASLAGVSCPGRDPYADFLGKPFSPVRVPGSTSEVALTFADGTAVAVSLPDVFEFARFTPRSRVELDCGDECLGQPITLNAYHQPGTRPTLTRYPGHEGGSVVLDYWGQLNFDAGEWVVRADVSALTEAGRAFVAKSVHLNLTPDGLFEYIGHPDLPLRVAESFDGGGGRRFVRRFPTKGVISYPSTVPLLELVPRRGGSSGTGTVTLAVSGCDDDGAVRQPFGTSSDYEAGQRCFPGTGIELGVEGGSEQFVESMLEETTLRVLRPRPERVVC